MSNRRRPRSPDVQIYRPQLTSVLSFTHRVSGIWLGLGSMALVAWLVIVANGGHIFVATERFLESGFGIALLFTWTFAVFYHLCNGIRHLAWDLDYGFELRNIYLTGWIVVAASVVLTLLTWALALTMGA